MADYKAPLRDMRFVLNEVFEADKLWSSLAGLEGAVDVETAEAILDECGKIASQVLAPINREGDEGTTLIHIGAENPLEPMKTCALVSANYYQEEVPVGSVGVIGPTRMFYENAIALVEATADYISASLTSQPELA